VNIPCYNFLAGSGFSEDQNRPAALGDFVDLSQDLMSAG
jgi:hypothetical protein